MNDPIPVHKRTWSEGESVPVATASEIRQLLNLVWQNQSAESEVALCLATLAQAELMLREAQNQAVRVATDPYSWPSAGEVEREAYNRGFAAAESKFRNWDKLLVAETDRDDYLERLTKVRDLVTEYQGAETKPRADHFVGWVADALRPPEPHAWQAPHSAPSGACGGMVMRGGGGDQCGLPQDHRVHGDGVTVAASESGPLRDEGGPR